MSSILGRGARQYRPVLFLLLAYALTTASNAGAQVSGAIYTSVCDGTTVNANLYDDRRDVYLNGGPQPHGPTCSSAGLSPDGLYYFQVTDPSGAVLLSEDPLNCRVVTVQNGMIVAYSPDAGCPSGANDGCLVRSDGPHDLGDETCVAGQASVQLFPYAETPNNGGVYKVWLMPVAALPLECDPALVDPASEEPCADTEERAHGFVSSESKTDNFRVRKEDGGGGGEAAGEITVTKFCDANVNGQLDPEELPGLAGIEGWGIDFDPDPNACSGVTDAGGFLVCSDLPTGSYDVYEENRSGYTHTTTCIEGVCGDPINPATIVVGENDSKFVDFGNVGELSISGRKCEDTNFDGSCEGEPGVAVVVDLIRTDGEEPVVVASVCTDNETGAFEFSGLPEGSYTVSEVPPANSFSLGSTTCDVELTLGEDCSGEAETCEFSNICLGAGGGHTLGFWSNKNGQKLISGADLAALTALNLRNANGTDFFAGSLAQVKSWLLSANATNMAYMLSAQLAAMKLNTLEPGFVNANDAVYAPGFAECGGVDDFPSVSELMATADLSLLDGQTPAGDPNRACQEVFKNALDDANNNENFVVDCQPTCATEGGGA